MIHTEETLVRRFDIFITEEMKKMLEDNNIPIYGGEYENNNFHCWDIMNYLEPGVGWLDDDFNIDVEEYDTNGNDSFIDEYGMDAEKCCVHCPQDNTWLDLGEFIKFCYDGHRGIEYCFDWKIMDKNIFGKRLQVVRDRKLTELI